MADEELRDAEAEHPRADANRKPGLRAGQAVRQPEAASAANKRPSTLSARYAFVFPRIFTSVALLIDKNILDLHAEIPRNLKGQQDRRVVAAVFKRADRLP